MMQRSWLLVLRLLFVGTLVLSPGCAADRTRGTTSDDASVVSTNPGADEASLRSALATSLRDEAIRRHAFVATSSERFAATNSEQRLLLTLGTDGVHVKPSAGGAWAWSMHLARIGRGSALEAVDSTTPLVDGNRARFVHGAALCEWYLHDASGLEQGFDVAERPAGNGELIVELATMGLDSALSSDGATISLRDASGREVLKYGQLHVKDADGRSVAARLTVAAGTIALRVDDVAARYPLVIDPLVWTTQTEMIATDAASGDHFGAAVAISGNTAVIGASWKPSGSNDGAAYVFVRTGTAWTQQAKLISPDGGGAAYFGSAVTISGDTVAIGSPSKSVAPYGDSGAVYVFVRSGTTWTFQTRIVPTDAIDGDTLGQSVSLDTDTLAIGAPNRIVGGISTEGVAYVYVRSGTTWTQQAKLVPADHANGDQFGSAVAVSGDTALIGAAGKTIGSNSVQGAVYPYIRSGTTWAPQGSKLVASDATAFGYYGTGLSLSGNIAVVGALYRKVGANDQQGEAYVVVRSGTTWSEQAKLVAADGAANDHFGNSVSIDATTIAVGAPGADGSRGAAYVYVQSGTTWALQGPRLVATDGAAADQFGSGVAVTGDTTIIGAPMHASASLSSGAAYAFVLRKSNGDACGVGSECGSTFCADGVCCDRGCAGTCEACTAAKKGTGADGACGFVGDTRDPDLECSGTTCVAGTQADTRACNGAGACRALTTTACGLFVCDAAGKLCLTTCAADASCVSTAWCNATTSTCTAKSALGGKCGAAHECTSGYCVDGVCCDGGCNGKCEACIAAATGGADGTCKAVTDGLDPRADCPGGSCSGATLTNNVCNGARACRANTVSCAPGVCRPDGTACLKKCSTSDDCGVDGYCAADGACAPRKKRAAACTADRECILGASCADGVCCDRACKGQCEACAEPGSEGTCLPVKGTPRSTHAPCNGAGSACAGQCDGINAAVCAYPGAGASCGAGCKDGKLSVCDATGGCLPPVVCPGSLMCDGTTKCKASCITDTDCVAGYVCTAGTCGPAKGKCSADDTSSISPDGKTSSTCAPYLCDPSRGTCRTECGATSDCMAGASCNDSKSCVADGVGGTDSGGGCEIAVETDSPAAPWLASCLLLGLGIAVRKRSRRSANDRATAAQ